MHYSYQVQSEGSTFYPLNTSPPHSSYSLPPTNSSLFPGDNTLNITLSSVLGGSQSDPYLHNQHQPLPQYFPNSRLQYSFTSPQFSQKIYNSPIQQYFVNKTVLRHHEQITSPYRRTRYLTFFQNQSPVITHQTQDILTRSQSQNSSTHNNRFLSSSFPFDLTYFPRIHTLTQPQLQQSTYPLQGPSSPPILTPFSRGRMSSSLKHRRIRRSAASEQSDDDKLSNLSSEEPEHSNEDNEKHCHSHIHHPLLHRRSSSVSTPQHHHGM